MDWRRKRQPTPVFLPGESQGQGSLVGCCLWGCTESDTTEATQQQQQQHACILSHTSHVQLFVITWTVALQAPLSMEFPRQEYWSGLLFPASGDLPDPGIEPISPASLALAAAAAAKSLQSCPTLCNPIDGSPPGSLVPGILQARTLEWVAISFSNA